uniref:Thioredoxin domain-containing protein n=1 Tax=Cryptomonas curvata TaxID=233186 RepID=A0A6T7WGS0_9CRYP
MKANSFSAILILCLISAVQQSSSLYHSEGCKLLSLRGGSASASVTGGNDLLKAGAQRRAQLAKKAEPKENLGLVGSIVKGISSVTNRIGITGSTTRVVGGKIVVTRNPIQQLTSLIYAIIHGIFIFFKSFVVPMKVKGDGSLDMIATKEEFDAALKEAGSKLVVVDFTASWCGPCQQIAPVFKGLAQEFKDVVFLKVDVDENKETAEHCGVTSMPTFQFYRSGSKLDEFSGADEDRLRSKITNNNYKAAFRTK